jgi:hypothetical protein
MAAQLLDQVFAIVVRGDFTPTIFQPAWFASHKLIRDAESDAAKVQVIHPSATVFTAEWLQLTVVPDRFHIATTQESFSEPLRDLVIGVMKIFNEIPLIAMGLNRTCNYRLESEEAWHHIGNELAPKKTWGSLLDKPGMRSLTMEGVRSDKREGYIQVKVEPSTTIKYGVNVELNDHYQLKSEDTTLPPGTQRASDILNECWTKSIERSLAIANTIAAIGDQR